MITGSLVAIVTPMHEDGRLDVGRFKQLIDWHVAEGTDGIVVVGTTGESPTVDFDEHKELIRLAVQHSHGRIPVIAGTGGNSTAEAIELTESAKKAGATACLSVVPYYNKPTQEGLYQHYKAIASSTPLPIVVYNVPGRTGCNIEPATVARLATIPNIVGIKEASGNMTQMSETCHAVPGDFLVLSGDDAMTVPLMAIGGRGLISVASNEIPAEMSRMVEAAEHGDYASAREQHHKLLPLMLGNFIESSPGPVKFAMSAMGLCEEVYRLPMVPIKDASKQKILGMLRDLGLAVAAHA
jgi:4-hydroxy-tetrahydrodipicolinate synthase